jgi:2-oxoglutarate ferredoxin oxidoreductase subunit gamma
MKRDVVLAGFGGQGMLLIGKLLSLAAMEEGKEVTWVPSYGPEMRGGTANVTVTIADEAIGAPVSAHPWSAAVMNQPSLEKFGPAIEPGGLLVINSSLVPVRFEREDIDVMYLPANDLANGIGATRSPNVVVFGAYVCLSDAVSYASARAQLEHQFGRKPKVLDINLHAFQLGWDAAAEFLISHGRTPPEMNVDAAQALGAGGV